jgi:biopolymer transport protein ExbB/TolQ
MEVRVVFGEVFIPALPVADVFYAFRESATPGKVIVLLLFLGSIIAWSVMLTKGIELRRAAKSSRRFLHRYRDQPHPISLYLRQQRFPESPHYLIYETGCRYLGAELEGPGDLGLQTLGKKLPDASSTLDRRQLEALGNLLERSVADHALRLEGSMGVLATSVSAAPFLGLLGTVWGVMDAFGGMAVMGTATLSAVAPGISGALLTTVVGLLVALPSSIGYNLLTGLIRTLTVEMDNFAQEFESALRRIYARE